MPNELALVTPAFNNSAHPPTLSASLRPLLADPYGLEDDSGRRWTMPITRLPVQSDVMSGIRELERSLEPASNPHIAFCMGLMSKTLASKSGSVVDWTLRTVGWIRACGELPDDLWTNATDCALARLKWFPEPVDFLKCDNVERTWGQRKRMLERAIAILKLVSGEGPKQLQASPLPTDEERHRGAIWRGWDCRTNLPGSFLTPMTWKSAQQSERWLATREGREPAAWAIDTGPAIEPSRHMASGEPPRIPDSAATRQRLLPSLIAFAKRNGRMGDAERYQAELDGHPIVTDVPEGHDFGGEDFEP